MIIALLKRAYLFLNNTLYYRWLRIVRRYPIPLAPTYQLDFKIEKLFSSEGEIFFGYHDKTPFNKSSDKVLSHHVKGDNHTLNSECTSIEIGYFQKGKNGQFDKHFIKVTETTLWSWQQGSMLQWDPLHPDSQIIFNDLVDGNYGARLYDLNERRIVKNINRPIYSMSKDGKNAVSLNFSRLARLRSGYGYKLLKDKSHDFSSSDDDGLFLMDMITGKNKLIVSLAQLAKSIDDSNNYEHYLNHANFSPDDSKIAFFHILNNKLDGKRSIRFCVYDLNSESVRLIDDNRLVSHYDWKGNDTIIAVNRDGNLKWHCSIYDLNDMSRTDLNSPLKTDGHPMVSPLDGNLAVIDSPPDKRFDQHLFLMDIKSGSCVELIALYSPRKFRGPVRCDLHPRWDRSGEYICVDTIFNGKREIVLLKGIKKEFSH